MSARFWQEWIYHFIYFAICLAFQEDHALVILDSSLYASSCKNILNMLLPFRSELLMYAASYIGYALGLQEWFFSAWGIYTKEIYFTKSLLEACLWHYRSSERRWQHGNIHHGWRAFSHGVWQIPGACSCLCRYGLGCRSHGAQSTVICRTVGSGGVESLCPRWEPTLKCGLCRHANRIMCLGLCFWQIWPKVWSTSVFHFF